MAARRYRMDKRAEAAAATRRRIVEATYALHGEQGIAATTMKQIAARADVGIGTVYHHFPTYDEIVRACGEYTFAMSPPPTAEIFDGEPGPAGRVRRLAHALFDFYRRCPGIEQARCDEDKIEALGEVMTALDRQVAELVEAALAPLGGGGRHAPVIAGLLDFAVHRRLVRQGMSTADAATAVADVITAWLAQVPQGTARRRQCKRKG